MLFTNQNINPKTLKIASLILTIAGIIFITFSNYIGIIAIRIAMLAILIFCLVDIKMTYKYLTKKEKLKYSLIILSSIIGIIQPELTMLIIGILLLFLTIPPYVRTLKSKDYSDIVTLLVNGTGIFFAIYCFLNSNAALSTVIIIIGIVFVIIGCLSLFEILTSKETIKTSNFEDNSEF